MASCHAKAWYLCTLRSGVQDILCAVKHGFTCLESASIAFLGARVPSWVRIVEPLVVLEVTLIECGSGCL